MRFEYNKVTKTVEILDLGLESPVLLINDVEVLNLEESTEYMFLRDGHYKLEVRYLSEIELTQEEIDLGVEPTYETIIQELGYVLVIEYSKARNRALLISILDEEKYDGLSSVYSSNRRLITEIENSFVQGNLRRADILFKELKW
jgi:hypothetical protein